MSKNFSYKEFTCKCCGTGYVSSQLITVLELVREHFNAPVIINSGFRCEKHNAEINGKSRSQHLKGTAADIVVKGIDPHDVYAYIDSIFPKSFGLGSYTSFTHIDVRVTKARW
jgi:uncharacterized protein YcbK (DUF882 family)